MALLKKPTAILIAVSFGMFTYASLGIRLWTAAFMVREFVQAVGLVAGGAVSLTFRWRCL